MLKDKNILFIVHNYNSFQKDQIEAVSKYFNRVYVLVRYNPLFRAAYYLSFGKFKKFNPRYLIDLQGKPNNITVIATPVWYLPMDVFYKSLGKVHLRAVEKAIDNAGIKFDFIHAHFLWSAGFVGAELKEKYKVPYIVTGHGYDVYSLPFKDAGWKERIVGVCEKADVIVTPSQANLEVFKSIGFGEKVVVIPNGFDREMFYRKDKKTCRSKLGIPEESKLILSVGNLEKIKGHIYLVQALEKVIKNHPNVICLMVGDGTQRPLISRLISRLNLGNNIFLVGTKKHADLVDYYNASDMLVVSSIKESFGVVQIEALACGIPVVATKNGGSEEIIKKNDYGILCALEDAEELSGVIEEGLRRDWDENEILMYAEAFAWDRLGLEFVRMYQGLKRIASGIPLRRS